MLRRFGFRALAPALNLSLFAALVVWGASPRLIAYLQAEGGVPFNPTENPFQSFLTTPRLFAIGLNAPAFLVSTLMVEVLQVPYNATAQLVLLLMCPFILLLWYLTGLWFDRRIGFLPEKVEPKRRVYLLVAIATVIGLALVWSLYRVWYFLNGGIAGWHGETPLNAAWTYGFALWLVLWQFMAVSSWRRSRTN